MSLDDRSRKFILIIEHDNHAENNTIPIEKIEAVCKEVSIEYFIILHDRDITPTGELKRPHYHIVIETAERIRAGTILNRYAKLLDVDKTLIQIEPCLNYNYHIRYLLHLDDESKAKYAPHEILTNAPRQLQLAFKNQTDKLKFDILYQVIEQCKGNKTKIMSMIGIGNYTTYYRAILDIISGLGIDELNN